MLLYLFIYLFFLTEDGIIRKRLNIKHV